MADFQRGGPFRTVLRIFFGALLILSLFLFILWRTENPRLQRLRLAMLDAVAPALESVAGASLGVTDLFDDIESYSELQAENGRLREQIDRLRVWRDLAQQLEEENGRLRALNAVKPAPRVSYVTAEVIGDAGGPFVQSLLINVGTADGVVDGAAALDATGLVGRVAGVGEQTARLLLLTDPSSRTPVSVGPKERRAMLHGDNSDEPVLQHLLAADETQIGDVVVTSGQGGVYPKGLHIGRVAAIENGAPRIRLSANYRQLEFVRVYRSGATTQAAPPGGLIIRAPKPAEEAGGSKPEAAAAAGAPGGGGDGG